MLLALGVIGSLLLFALPAAAIARLSLAKTFLLSGSALAVLLAAVTGNVVGGAGLELTILPAALGIHALTATSRSRRRRRAIRRVQARQLARAAGSRDRRSHPARRAA